MTHDQHSQCRWTDAAAEIVVPPRRGDVIVEALADEVVFSDPVDGRTYHLNSTARHVWDACDGVMTTRRIAMRLLETYDVSFERALEDVEQIVVSFAEAGLLRSVRAT